MLQAVNMPESSDVPAQAGSPPPSLEGFFAEVGARAFRFAETGLRQREDALDAVQDAMLRMLAYRERPAGEWPPLFWAVLRSRIIDIQRRRSFRLRWLLPQGDKDEESLIDWADDGPAPDRAHDNREAYERLVAALRDLPRRQREAFTLRVLEDMDVETTATVMGCSQGSVKTHLFRARDALQKQLEDWQ